MKGKHFPSPEGKLLIQDRALKLYFSKYAKDDGSIAHSTWNMGINGFQHFMHYTKRPITATCISDLIAWKKANPKDRTIEEELQIFSNEPTVSTHRQWAAYVVDVFHANGCNELDISIHISNRGSTIPIKEPILRTIFTDPDITDEERDAMLLMAYAGERINALISAPCENVHFVEDTNSALIDLPSRLTKNRVRHVVIIPRALAEKLLQKAQKHGYPCIMPNGKSLWKRITMVAKTKYAVRLTSHYMRKRFQTIGETTNASDMSPNHWVILMGEKPNVGHMPDIYSL